MDQVVDPILLNQLTNFGLNQLLYYCISENISINREFVLSLERNTCIQYFGAHMAPAIYHRVTQLKAYLQELEQASSNVRVHEAQQPQVHHHHHQPHQQPQPQMPYPPMQYQHPSHPIHPNMAQMSPHLAHRAPGRPRQTSPPIPNNPNHHPHHPNHTSIQSGHSTHSVQNGLQGVPPRQRGQRAVYRTPPSQAMVQHFIELVAGDKVEAVQAKLEQYPLLTNMPGK